jgi:hypothetical protein
MNRLYHRLLSRSMLRLARIPFCGRIRRPLIAKLSTDRQTTAVVCLSVLSCVQRGAVGFSNMWRLTVHLIGWQFRSDRCRTMAWVPAGEGGKTSVCLQLLAFFNKIKIQIKEEIYSILLSKLNISSKRKSSVLNSELLTAWC